MITSPEAVLPRIDWRFVASRPAHLIACGFGAGLYAAAPGTAGTLVALPLYWLLSSPLAAGNGAGFILLVAVCFAVGVWACSVTGRALGNSDHGAMVWDEITAFLLVLFFTPDSLTWLIAAFILFRLFDVMKPWPIRYFERTFTGGFGVMFDDMLAAFYTLICLALMRSF